MAGKKKKEKEKKLMKETEDMAAQLGIDLSQLDLNSITLPPGDNFGIESSDDEDIVQEYNRKYPEISINSKSDNMIAVDNLPVVPPEKIEKLEAVVRRIYSEIGKIVEDGFDMPVDQDTKKTKGYCFIEFNTPQEAETAKARTQGLRLDKTHTLAVNFFSDLEKLEENSPEEWVPPETKPYIPGENLRKWLTDGKARDQFVIRFGSDVTQVLWNDVKELKAIPVYERSNWTEKTVQWSPQGTYLATFHRQGTAIWGGASTFERILRFTHSQVKLIDFSPGEKYLVTYSNQETRDPDGKNSVVINIFDVRTGKLMRDFRGTPDDFPKVRRTGEVSPGVSWPVFKWGGGRGDKYFARIRKNLISVYETETFSLIGKKPLEFENVKDFSWSPTDPVIALFVPELQNQLPGTVSLVQIPSKDELRQKKLFDVIDCKMHWQSNGDYLAAEVGRYRKNRRSTYTGFELFRMREKDIPVEDIVLEKKKDAVFAFAWEPKGHRFGVIHGDGQNLLHDISFYSTRSSTNASRVSKLTTLKGKSVNSLLWSPAGRFVVFAGRKGLAGEFGFFDADELQIVGTVEHYMATDIEWDPTGRYVATAAASAQNIENGFNIWSFYGKLLYEVYMEKLSQFSWRPRPPSILSPKKEEEIAKNLSKYSEKYEAEDEDVLVRMIKQRQERERAHREEWAGWVSEWKRLSEEEESAVQALLGDGEARDHRENDDKDDDDEEYYNEELLSRDEEIVPWN